ncbi:MAG TPA: HAMP domain-containing sensor histidine kinase [Streptosporangiaceae bacterium]|nr:HAMP domain-containing sensor histidine kinase [Streptosporangiaceae bacterium]
MARRARQRVSRTRSQSQRVNRTRSQSLRNRLLLLQVAVTAIFLLVLGVVSTELFAHNLTSQFNSIVVDESTRSPLDLTERPSPGVFAVLANLAPFRVHDVSGPDRKTTQLRTAILRMGQPVVFGRARHSRPFLIAPSPGHSDYHLVAAARVIPATLSPTRATEVIVVAEQSTAVTNELRGLIAAEIVTGCGLIALLAIGGRWLIARGLEPLDRMTKTAGDITARGDLTERMAIPDDQTEVGKLGVAINTMLDRIQQAFGARLNSERKVREFAADASHELRTPLTTIRGYAELYRQGALGPDQVPTAMRRIEQEAQRMSTLVAELLELARLDRTSSLDLSETDLATVVRDAVADAMAVEPERPISAQAPPRLIAVVDERRIRQVLSNLLGNVRAHTDPSTPVAVRLGRVQGGVLIEVADAGPGMGEEDAARAFDRFHRATERAVDAENNGNGNGDFSSGGGSGLGLSIVQAIAVAHGGQATLESWTGHGTRVRIWLPSRAQVQAASLSASRVSPRWQARRARTAPPT